MKSEKGKGGEAMTAGKLASRLRTEIDLALDADYIEPDRVDDYIAGLDSLLDRIYDFGESESEAALSVALYFVREIPSVFNNVHDECELEMFCCDLAESVMALATETGGSVLEPTVRLVEAYLGDAHDACRFDDVPDILAKARLSKDDRAAVAGLLMSKAAKADEREATRLRGLANIISGPRTMKNRR